MSCVVDNGSNRRDSIVRISTTFPESHPEGGQERLLAIEPCNGNLLPGAIGKTTAPAASAALCSNSRLSDHPRKDTVSWRLHRKILRMIGRMIRCTN